MKELKNLKRTIFRTIETKCLGRGWLEYTISFQEISVSSLYSQCEIVGKESEAVESQVVFS